MSIHVIDILQKPHEEDNLPLNKILSGRLKRLGREKTCDESQHFPYWSASYFRLNDSGLYLNLSEKQQQTIVNQCNENILLESYFIEKLGMAYCAKMSLASETVEASQAYALIGADEATHLRWLTPFIENSKRTTPMSDFLNYLVYLVDEADAKCVVFILQIILEGWGLKHYQRLANHCANTKLKTILEDIVRDEALHHQAGIALFNSGQLSDSQFTYLLDSMACFLEMIRMGPQAIINSVDKVSGGMNRNEKINLIQDISGSIEADKKLNEIKQLMMIPGCEKILEYLESKNLFTAYSAECCV